MTTKEATMDRMQMTIHKIESDEGNGVRVRYWSVYEQVWKDEDPRFIPDQELAAMNGHERARIARAANIARRAW